MAGKTRPTLLVGSVNLIDAEAVFRIASRHLGNSLRSLPDGETGGRLAWIGWQAQVLRQCAFLQPSEARSGGAYDGGSQAPTRYRLVGDPETAGFPDLGYAQAALQSYAVFESMRRDGEIPRAMRFQVSLPTPLAPLAGAVEPDDFLAVEKLYEQAMRRELEEIGSAIPHQALAVQWDAAIEVAVLEGVAMRDGIHLFANPLDDLCARLAAVIDWIPEAVTAGFHLCYGDYGHRHFVEPRDTGLMVQMANTVFARAHRRIDWCHMPVPKSRDDDAYFTPLSNLRKPAETQLYLGLAHQSDGMAGGVRRMAAAHRHVDDFGVSTECGMGRRPPETIEPLMALMSALAVD